MLAFAQTPARASVSCYHNCNNKELVCSLRVLYIPVRFKNSERTSTEFRAVRTRNAMKSNFPNFTVVYFVTE